MENSCPQCGGSSTWHANWCVRPIPDARHQGTQAAIKEECDAICKLLQEKNALYGDSALNPVRILSKASAEEQILVRCDDKLSRLARGNEAGEDCILDLIGYLVLLRIARRK